MMGVYAISFVFGAAIVLTNDPADNGGWIWMVAAIPLIPVFQGLVCRYLSNVSLGMQSLPEEKPLVGVIPWIGLVIWLVPLLLLWWYFSDN
jgi:cobalamin synthase